jgi:hypothetical protein
VHHRRLGLPERDLLHPLLVTHATKPLIRGQVALVRLVPLGDLVLDLESAADVGVMSELVVPILSVQLQIVLCPEELLIDVLLVLELLVDFVDGQHFVWSLKVHFYHVHVCGRDRVPQIVRRVRIVQLQFKLHI